jgi:hypothetical protein
MHLTITIQYTTDELKMAITEYIRNVDRAILNTVFENTVRRVNNVWRLAGDTFNITCNFLYCNYQVNRDFLITLYFVATQTCSMTGEILEKLTVT